MRLSKGIQINYELTNQVHFDYPVIERSFSIPFNVIAVAFTCFIMVANFISGSRISLTNISLILEEIGVTLYEKGSRDKSHYINKQYHPLKST